MQYVSQTYFTLSCTYCTRARVYRGIKYESWWIAVGSPWARWVRACAIYARMTEILQGRVRKLRRPNKYNMEETDYFFITSNVDVVATGFFPFFFITFLYARRLNFRLLFPHTRTAKKKKKLEFGTIFARAASPKTSVPYIVLNVRTIRGVRVTSASHPLSDP